MDVAQLAERVRPPADVPPILSDKSTFAYISAPATDYIPPPIATLRDDPGAALSLVVAPAATGKSALANYLAATSGAPLWDIHDLQVGNSTFSGQAMEAFGAAGTRLLGLVPGRSVPVIVDALDEAHLRAGESNFDGFCRDLCRTIAHDDAATALLLARSETATYVQMILEDLGLPYSFFRLEYFDEQSAHAFIDRRLRSRALRHQRTPLQDRHQRRYEEQRDNIFSTITAVIAPTLPRSSAWQDSGVKSFLGYAPVLQAIADYLDYDHDEDEGSPFASSLPHATDHNAPWLLLRCVVDHILLREQRKFIAGARKAIDVADLYGWDDWSDVFSPREQLDRCMLWTHGVPAPASLCASGIPDVLHARYEELVNDHLPQHAFVSEAGPSGRSFANGVFEEYAIAELLLSSGRPATALGRERLSRRSPLASPLLARFMLTGSTGQRLELTDAPYLYYSLRESTDQLRNAWLNVTEDDESVEIFVIAGEERFEIAGTKSAADVVFLGNLHRLGVVVKNTLRLGSGGELRIGPEAVLGGDTVIIHAERVYVHGEGRPSVIGGGALGVWPPHQHLTVDDGAHYFAAFALDVPHPHTRYGEVDHPLSDANDLDAAALFFWRILSRFRGSQSALGRLRCSALLIERIEVGQSMIGQRLYQHLLSIGLIKRAGKELYLDTSKFGPLGLTFNDISHRHRTPQLDIMLSDFLAK